jgi:hypothetical protein
MCQQHCKKNSNINMKKLNFLFTALMMCFASQMIGQDALTRSLSQAQSTTEITRATKTGAFGEVIKADDLPSTVTSTPKDSAVRYMDMVETETKTIPPVSKAVIFHDAKVITEELGFYIQLSITTEPLDKTHAIFQEFGNLKVQKTNPSIFCYLIGDFATENTAKKFLENVILVRYPEATVVELKKGERVN